MTLAMAEVPERNAGPYLAPRDGAKFTAVVALFAIFIDAAIGHGLLWENDPYWTYWITKTFLIATIFGFGTLIAGLGAGRGAVITAVHTLVLTIYYWSLSPIGLPSSPEWLDLEHTWITGVPVHFGVIYLGYLIALWIWRKRGRGEPAAGYVAELPSEPRRLGLLALEAALAIVVVAGGVASLALQEFPGATWFVVRLLITFSFVGAWWAAVGRGRTAAILGGAMLALIWTTYGHFLGPNGLPDLPLRILEAAPPGAKAEWANYRDLWLMSLPIYSVLMIAILLLFSERGENQGVESLVPSSLFAAPLVLLLIVGFISPSWSDASEAELSASGTAMLEEGEWYSNEFTNVDASIRVETTDQGGRVTPVPPHDKVSMEVELDTDAGRFTIRSNQPLVNDPIGKHTTWWGVGMHVDHHGRSGIGTNKLPNIDSELAIFALGDVELDGEPVASGVPLHAMTADSGLPESARLELDVGREGTEVAGLPNGHLRILWTDYQGAVPKTGHNARYALGSVVLLVMLIAALALNRNRPDVDGTSRLQEAASR